MKSVNEMDKSQEAQSHAIMSANNRSRNCQIKRLQKGVVLLENFLSETEQIHLLDLAKQYDIFNTKFYCRNEKARNIHMMCMGSTYVGGEKVVQYPIPPYITDLSKEALALATDTCPLLKSTRKVHQCMLNYYKEGARLSAHDERYSRGAVISFSVGASADFFYKKSWKKTLSYKTVTLKSGDVFVFGGPSRGIVHGVKNVHMASKPDYLDFDGRINFNVREK